MESRGEQIRRAKAQVAEHGADMAERYASGQTLKAIASDYGVTAMTVAKAVRARGVPIREAGNAGRGDAMRTSRQIRRERGTEMAEMYAAGATLQEVADRYSVSLGVARKAVLDIGATLRKRGFGSTPGRFTMDGNPAWKSGRVQREDGYVTVLLPPDSPWISMANHRRYVLEHRLVMAQLIHRPLDKDETVHHIDGDRSNNDPSNLQLRRGRHGKGVHLACADCGSRNVGPVPL